MPKKGYKQTEKHRIKNSEARIKEWQNPEHRKHMSEVHKGKKGYLASNWKGGKRKDSRGYILIYKPDHPFAKVGKYVLEHRLVVEKQIGRYLLTKEPCHHLGKRDDNRPHMLMAFVNDSAHMRFEQGSKVKEKEIIFDGRKL